MMFIPKVICLDMHEARLKFNFLMDLLTKYICMCTIKKDSPIWSVKCSRFNKPRLGFVYTHEWIGTHGLYSVGSAFEL
jgi:hypothetical protein